MRRLSNIYVFIIYISLFILHFLSYNSVSSAFQCSRHTSRYRDVPSLTLTSPVVLDVRPTTTSLYDVTHADVCHVTFTVRHVFKDSAAALNESQTPVGAKRLIRAAFCAESGISGVEATNGSSRNGREGCAEQIFRAGIDKNYLVFMDVTERIDSESRRIVGFVSDNQPIVSNKQALKDVRKYNCSKCGRKPSARLKPEYSMTVDLHKRLEVHCRISGSPLPQVEWMRNGDVLDISQKRYKVKDTKRGSRLRIRKAESTDCGEYYCRAVNVLGESTSHSVYVIISPDVSCAAQHKHPCKQQTYCLNGGTCWVLTNLGTEFCQCTNEYEGERCAEKVWTAAVLHPVGTSKILPISVIAVVCGATTVIAVFLIICYASRKCSAITRKKTNSRDTVVSSKDYSKLVGDNTGTLPSAQRTQITYTDDQLSVKDQSIQTEISHPGSPLIHVEIQSAIIQSPDCMNYRGSGPGLDYWGSGPTGLDHVDSLASRNRLSAVSTTPGAGLDRLAIKHSDDNVGLDDVDYHLQELGIRAISFNDIPSPRDNLSPLSAVAAMPSESSPARDSRLFNSQGISRYTKASSPLGSPSVAEYDMELSTSERQAKNGGKVLNRPGQFQQKSHPILKNQSSLPQQWPSSSRDGVNSQQGDLGGSFGRNISNPDILESIGNDNSKENPPRERNVDRISGVSLENSKRDRNSVSGAMDNISPYDSDPEATVV